MTPVPTPPPPVPIGTTLPVATSHLRRVILAVAVANLAYGILEAGVGLAIGSVSLLGDAADFGEDAAINLLIVAALGLAPGRRHLMGRLLAGVVLVPAAVAGWQLVVKIGDPVAPSSLALTLTALGAAAVNLGCALALVRIRRAGGSLTQAAWLAARNDVAINVLVMGVGGLTALTSSGWPDVVAGLAIIALGLHAAWEVWEAAEGEGDDDALPEGAAHP